MLISHFKSNHRREKVIMENLKIEDIPTSTDFKNQIDEYVEIIQSQEIPQEAPEEEVETDYESGSLPDLITNAGSQPNLNSERDRAVENLETYAASLPNLIMSETDHVIKNLKILDRLSNDCDCKCCKRNLELKEYDTMKTYTLAFLQDLMAHELRLVDQINNFFLNVKELDRGIKHRNMLKKMQIRTDNLMKQMRFGNTLG